MRIYQGDSTIPNDPKPHTFVEITKDHFLEVDLPVLLKIDTGFQQRLRAFTRKIRAEEKRNNTYHIRLHTRFFTTLHPVPNLHIVGTF